MDSIYFRDPNGQLLELACYKFVPPDGSPIPAVVRTAPHPRVARGASHCHARPQAPARGSGGRAVAGGGWRWVRWDRRAATRRWGAGGPTSAMVYPFGGRNL